MFFSPDSFSFNFFRLLLLARVPLPSAGMFGPVPPSGVPGVPFSASEPGDSSGRVSCDPPTGVYGHALPWSQQDSNIRADSEEAMVSPKGILQKLQGLHCPLKTVVEVSFTFGQFSIKCHLKT